MASRDVYKSFQVIGVGETAPAMDHLLGVMNGLAAGAVLIGACKLEIFDKIEECKLSCTTGKLAEETGWDAEAVERLLDSLVALKFVKKEPMGETYTYSNMESGKYLIKNGEPTAWESIARLGKMVQGLPDALADEVKTGKHKTSSFPAQVTVHIPSGDQGHGHGHSHHHGHGHGHGHGPQTPAVLIERYRSMEGLMLPYMEKMLDAIDMTGYQTLVDLGAGSGIVGISMSKRYPSLQVTLFEVDPVINIVKKYFLPKAGDNLNVSLVKGDFFVDELPAADVYVLGKIIHDWNTDQVSVLLTRVLKSLNPGGTVVLLEKCLDDAKDGPPSACLWDSMVMSKCAGRLRSGKELDIFLSHLGFTQVKIVKFKDGCQTDVITAKKN